MPSSGVRIARLAEPEQPVGVRGAELGDPPVVGLEARLLVVERRVWLQMIMPTLG